MGSLEPRVTAGFLWKQSGQGWGVAQRRAFVQHLQGPSVSLQYGGQMAEQGGRYRATNGSHKVPGTKLLYSHYGSIWQVSHN